MTETSESPVLTHAGIEMVRDTCLCFAAQRAGRVLARRFDLVFQPLGLTNGQYSMMAAIAAMGNPKLGALASFMAMDHTTVTAAIKALEKRGLMTVAVDANDRRARRASLTRAGRALLTRAVPLWQAEHARLDAEVGTDAARQLRRDLFGLTETRD